MLNELQKTKLDRRFTLLDVNGDGTIQQDDYEELAQRLISGANLRPADPKAAAVASSLLDIWQALGAKVDTDRDGKITQDEWRRSVEGSLIERDGFDRVIGPAAAAVLAAYDADGNGAVSADEFRTFLTAMRVEPASADESFRRLNSSGSGMLSVDEITVALRDFYTSADPEAPGNWLYGPV